MSEEELDPLVSKLLDMNLETARSHAESTKGLINRFFALMAVLLIVNGGLSGANLAMNFMGVASVTASPTAVPATVNFSSEDRPPIRPVYLLDTGTYNEAAGEEPDDTAPE